MYRIFLIPLSLVLFVGCKAKKNGLGLLLPQTSEVYITTDDRLELMRSAFIFALDDRVLDSIYTLSPQDYYHQVLLKYEKVRNHPLVDFIDKSDYVGVDLPTIAFCFEPKTFQLRNDLIPEILKSNFGKASAKLDTLSVLLRDYYQKSHNSVALPKINYSNFYAAFHALELNQKIDAYCRSKVKSRVVIYYDPLNSNVSKVLDFIQPVDKHSFLVLGLERSLEDASQVDLIITDRMVLQLLEGLIGNYTLPLYRNHGRMELEKQGIHGLELAQYEAFDHLINLVISSRIGTQQLGLKTVPEALYPWQNTAAFQLVEQRLAAYEQDKKKSFEVFYRELLNELISGVAAGTIEL